ncbi:radical SAM/SPASM domain-containing protein [Tenuifilaceae bacterium CYCD]|nr:radical SAM/SPASM domain-containing protein [Tenuifilaceae bacterium CYCD]
MKFSSYNYFIEYDSNYLGINMISEAMFCLNQVNYNKLMDCNNDPNVLELNEPIFFSLCNKLGLIIEDDVDELLIIKAKYHLNIYNDNIYRLTINPTLDCNFNCWYCYETHLNDKMEVKTIDNIIKHVKYIVENKRIKMFQLDWFGGEPLLYFDEIVYPISLEVLKICYENNVSFSNTITTNGFLINDSMIEKFDAIKLLTFQITFDGSKENHDRVRKTRDGKGSYDVIALNINRLCEKLNNVNICLRINYQNSYLCNLNKVVDSFPLENRSKIEIFLQQIWQMEKCEKAEDLTEIRNMFETSGFKRKTSNQYFKGYRCYADKFNQAVINTNGAVFKCTARDFYKEKPDGVLLEDGQIDWNFNKISKRYGQSPFEAIMCVDCKFLPLCLGACSQKMVDYGLEGLTKKYCLEEGIKIALNERLIEFYSNIMKEI